MRKIKREDEVVVLTGKDKGKRGKVSKVLADGRLLVAGVNIIKKHTRPNPQAGVTGGIVEKEAPIYASNIAIFNTATNEPLSICGTRGATGHMPLVSQPGPGAG